MTQSKDSDRRVRILRQHVATDGLLGVEAVPLGAATVVVNATGHTRRPTEDRETRIRLLAQMDQDEVRTCTRCPLWEGRTKTVFGEGDPEANIMFIGEGPGQSEDEQGRPFVGRAGDLLNRQIEAMGMQRQAVYIANVVKCRPPQNRAPTPIEVDACYSYLKRQIRILLPKVIITLGAPATKLILDTKEGITKLRGQWYTYDGLLPDGPKIPVMPTFHPAYLLRAYTEENRRKTWSDLQQVMAKLGSVE